MKMDIKTLAMDMDSIKQTMDNNNDYSTPDLQLQSDNADPALSVSEFYQNQIILVTGGTGFLGKALLEKLLRSCHGIESVYVLLRPKRGLSVEQRFKELLKNQVFDRIRARWPERLSKLQPIAGDVSAPQLGISVTDMALVATVTVVFHSAATVRFTEPLRAAHALNVLGAASLLQVARLMPQLKALVHVSTAYSNAPHPTIEERVYPATVDPLSPLAPLSEGVPEEVLLEALRGEHPNTYTLTKSMAETIVNSQKDLPVCIVRPSIVTAALQEPFPGWIDNIYGVTGIIMEISRGTYRSGFCKERLVVDLVPVDLVVNSCILAAWRQAVLQPGHCPVYNVTSGSINPIQWGQFTRLCLKWARENPTKYVMWYPNFSFTESRLVNTFWEYACHFIPALLYDVVLRAQGRKALMMKLARRFRMAAATGEYFANHQWTFQVDQLTALHNAANKTTDVGLFPHWPSVFNWNTYIGTYMMGIRKFILKDGAESLPMARTKLNRLYWIYRIIQAATGYYVIRTIATRFRYIIPNLGLTQYLKQYMQL